MQRAVAAPDNAAHAGVRLVEQVQPEDRANHIDLCMAAPEIEWAYIQETIKQGDVLEGNVVVQHGATDGAD